ncbi:hypothetical protein Y032_0067g65 [Ancylostoma ceylanicum]|uniref:Uncharacterized protein n=1 Tax=Ancylostoma ceylanicum TaxID=53326 RepID=A0A016TYU6_9BILA|nr:hypothetical protein Y032_0067g65 [Ancylostoma ceylanicum]
MTPSATKSHKIGFRSRGLIQPSDSISTLSLSLTSAGNSRAGETHDGSTHTTTARGDLYPCLSESRIHQTNIAPALHTLVYLSRCRHCSDPQFVGCYVNFAPLRRVGSIP